MILQSLECKQSLKVGKFDISHVYVQFQQNEKKQLNDHKWFCAVCHNISLLSNYMMISFPKKEVAIQNSW